MERREYLIWAIIALMFISGAYIYPSMPETMATHWDAEGNVNGYSTRAVGVFLIPALTLGIYLLMLAIPHIAVYRKNIESFKKYYFYMIAGIVIFLAVVQSAMLAANMGYAFEMNYIIMPTIAVLFYGIGIILEKTRRNFFIGIRTPWTLSSDAVWEKTNRIGSKMFRVFGVLAVLSLFVPGSLLFFIAAVFIGVIYLFAYSYLEYEKEKKR
ncbi:MAG: SdpI family protein [Candidatus Aenigmarchaeota archaeon]|nr:SdpI family protein [Candidatus Aenigmarchaeota archaeon]